MVRLDPAQGDAFSVIRASPSAVNKGRVESVHVVMIIIYEKTFAHSCISVGESIHVELEFIGQESALFLANNFLLLSEDNHFAPVFFCLHLGEQVLSYLIHIYCEFL